MSTTINGTTGINRVEPTASGLPYSMRNKIINGKMDVWQRGVNFPAIQNAEYTADRWKRGGGTSSVVYTISKSSDVPTNNEFSSSLRLTVTTPDNVVGVADNENVQHVIEGYNARDLIGRAFTLSFWVKSSKTGVHCVSLGNAGGDRSYILEYTVGVANSWEYKSIVFSDGLTTSGTWGWENNFGLAVRFSLMAGTSFQGNSGQWLTGNYLATSNQVNCLDTVGNIFSITGVQLEVGSVATPFEHRPYGTELALCQRYYQTGNVRLLCYQSSGAGFEYSHVLPTVMRAAPTIVYSGVAYLNASGLTTSIATATDFVPSASATAAGPARFTAAFTATSEL